MYQRKYWAACQNLGRGGRRGRWADLARANLVESDKGKRLGEHGRGEVLFGEDEGDEDAREEELGEEGDGFDAQLGG